HLSPKYKKTPCPAGRHRVLSIEPDYWRGNLSRFFSRVAAPIPFTSSHSPPEANGPRASRRAATACALPAPIPFSSRSRVAASAVLRLILPPATCWVATGLAVTGFADSAADTATEVDARTAKKKVGSSLRIGIKSL